MDDRLLNKTWAPVRTGTPCCSPHMCLMALPDGELRAYGAQLHGQDSFTFVVQKSTDWGMSWRLEPVDNLTPGASVQSPWSGDWLCMLNRLSWKYDIPSAQFAENQFQPIMTALPSDGVWLFRSTGGPDADFSARKILDEDIHLQRLPLPLKHRRRWIVTGQQRLGDFIHPVLLISDDDGSSWAKQVLPYPPLHELKWPHRGYRWRQPGVEPVVAEHADGTLQMLLRTSQDFHYQCFSHDGGDSWTDPEPSPFYSVATMPNLLALSDGRLVAVWNNTTPLPEVDHAMQPELDQNTRNGVWEDVFTNRDVLHAAISSDSGRSWRGFRELALNPIRNDADFRTSGGNFAMFDRSVHQNQALELPGNKLLVGYGQHPKCWGLLVFDLGWLDEKSREEDFSHGLDGWSTHQYVRSRSGGYSGRGHCAYNRRPGACLMPSPDGSFRESLLIARHPDSRLLYEKEGATWNFPATRHGRLAIGLTLMPRSAGMRIGLCDRWFNPVDPVVGHFCAFSFELDAIGRLTLAQDPANPSIDPSAFSGQPGEDTCESGMDLQAPAQEPMLSPGVDAEVTIEFDQDTGIATACCGARHASFPMAHALPDAISYLHLQSLAETADPFGVMVNWVKFESLAS